VFLVGSHAAFGPIDRSLGLGLFGCTITKEKLIKTIQKVFAADPDLSFILQLSEFKLATLVATVRERIDRGSDNAGRILATRNSFPPPAKEQFPVWLMSTWTKWIANDKPFAASK